MSPKFVKWYIDRGGSVKSCRGGIQTTRKVGSITSRWSGKKSERKRRKSSLYVQINNKTNYETGFPLLLLIVPIYRSSLYKKVSSYEWKRNVFFCVCYIKHLMTGPEGNSEFCFSRISMSLETKSRETFRGKQNSLFPKGLIIKWFVM